MSYLRHISTRRLLALLAATVVVLAGGAAAIALAAGGSGPTPPPKPLAQAVHDALAAPPSTASRRGSPSPTTSIDAASLQGCDPLLTGAKGRLWATGDKLRLELQASSADGRAGDVQVLLDGDQLTVIETALEHRLPGDAAAGHAERGSEPVPSLARIQERAHPPDREGDALGRAPERRRRAPGVHRAHRAAPRRRPARRRRGRVGRRARRAAARRRLRRGCRRPGARAEGDRHLLRQGGRQRPRHP